jgi:uncharacterized damage-inducible protein DinB
MRRQSTLQHHFSDKRELSEIGLREANCCALEEGVELLRTLPADLYIAHFKPAFQSTIGAHYRHVLEHYHCFLGQLESGIFNYDERARAPLLEQDSAYAIRTIESIIDKLNALNFDLPMGEYQLLEHYAAQPIATNLARELAFLQSHTVHHFAMIAAIARGLGLATQADFGVAIATLCYQQSKAQE